MANQDIHCSVQTCKHYENSQKCSLNSISVGQGAAAQAQNKAATECDSFEAKNAAR